MGSCLSKKKAASKKQQNGGKSSNKDLLSATADVSIPSTHPRCEKPLPEDVESVKEILSEMASRKSQDVPVPLALSFSEPKQQEAPIMEALVNKPSAEVSNNLNNQCSEQQNLATTSPSETEDVDAILIQCGRLSRSSSNNNGPGCASRSGSKRHATDASQDGKEPRARAAHRRRPSSGDLVRSVSQERQIEEGKRTVNRRISPSPGRRGEPSPGRRRSESQRQRVGSASVGNSSRRQSSSAARSRSPATRISLSNNGSSSAISAPSLSRSSSKKADQLIVTREASKAEIAAVSREASKPEIEAASEGLKGEENNAPQAHPSAPASASASQILKERRVPFKEINSNIPMRDQLIAYKVYKRRSTASEKAKLETENAPPFMKEIVQTAKIETENFPPPLEENMPDPSEIKPDKSSFSDEETKPSSGGGETGSNVPATFTRTRSQRRSREHFILDSKGLELPPSVSKACSILEAVADLNSSVNSNTLVLLDELGSEQQQSSNFYCERDQIIQDLNRWLPEQSLEESAASNGYILKKQGFCVSPAVSSETSSFSKPEDDSSGLNNHSRPKASNLLPVITFPRKNFQRNGDSACSLASGKAISAPRQVECHLQHEFCTDLELKADSCPAP